MIEIYTDGSAVVSGKNKGLGGFGVVFTINGKVKKVMNGGYKNTKTGRMELTAVLKALKILSKDQSATIFSDSMYVVNTFSKNWILKWKRSGWPCKNKDLMQKLLIEFLKFPKGSVSFVHVKGHSGNKFNELADELANYKNFNYFKKDL